MRRETMIEELIVAFAPVAERSIWAHEEVRRLRARRETPHPAVEDLLHATPLTISRSESGKWRYSIALRHNNTSGGEFESYDEAFRAAVARFGEMMFDRKDEDDDG